MPLKQTGRKQYTTMQGKNVDMDLLRQRNELTPAVGNARVNARGDELGPGGKIVKKREDVLKEYYQDNPGTPDEIVEKRSAPVEEKPKATTAKAKTSTTQKAKTTTTEDEWVEDEDGNFVKKGD